MMKSPQIPGFGKYGERQDGTDARQRLKPHKVGVAAQQLLGLKVQLLALFREFQIPR